MPTFYSLLWSGSRGQDERLERLADNLFDSLQSPAVPDCHAYWVRVDWGRKWRCWKMSCRHNREDIRDYVIKISSDYININCQICSNNISDASLKLLFFDLSTICDLILNDALAFKFKAKLFVHLMTDASLSGQDTGKCHYCPF